jgi:hypothetical protein
MSEKEIMRRKVARAVLSEAWKLLKRAKVYGWSTVLRLSWRVVRSRICLHYSKASGVAASGTSRQAQLHQLAGYKPEDISLVFVRDYDNKFDVNAIRISASIDGNKWFTVGYVKSQIAAIVAPLMDRGYEVVSVLKRITGKGSKGLYGMNFQYAIM